MTGQVCACGDTLLCHQVEQAPGCCRCDCRGYQPLAPGQTPVPVTMDVHALLQAARDTGAPKCIRLADRIAAEIDLLRTRVANEHARVRYVREHAHRPMRAIA